MKFNIAATAALAASSVHANSVLRSELEADILEAAIRVARALPNSPNGYTPSRVNCPSSPPAVRLADSLSQNETAWLELRRNNTIGPMREFLTRMNISGFDAASYINRVSQNASELPNIGVAFSGGGWRALMNSAGVFQAFDGRTENSSNTGQLGGLLQASTYVSGLSGGSWLVGAIYVNNFTTVSALQADDTGNVWEFGNSVLEGPASNGIQILSTAEYYKDIYDTVEGKRDAGYDTSLTDVWGRGLSYQLINATGGGASYTWSSIALTEGFQNADMPFPLVVADARRPGQILISLNASNYEFNPFEMGTWDPTAFGFVPLQYIGTNFTAGAVDSTDNCIVGFDNAGFILGTSSSLFNQFLLNLNGTSVPDALRGAIQSILSGLGKDNNDIADYSPNPFYGWNPTTNPNAEQHRLTLVDGGEDGQNIPLNPLIQPVRELDVIFAVDSSADTTYFWPNGTSLVATYERTLGPISNGTGFPSIPDQNTFVNLGLNSRPTFFGCDTSNYTNGENSPLIVYLPNYPYVTNSNISTFQLSTNNTQRDAIILNGYMTATMGNGTRDSTWPTCVGCAILSRSFGRTNTEIPAACQECFNKFCWDGTLNSTTPPVYEPTIIDAVNIQSSASSFAVGSWSSLATICAGLTLAFISM